MTAPEIEAIARAAGLTLFKRPMNPPIPCVEGTMEQLADFAHRILMEDFRQQQSVLDSLLSAGDGRS